MNLIPAIDLQDNKVVRLFKGHFNKVTEYEKKPLEVAKEWVDAGAKWIHIVDLDGARTGEMKNFPIVEEIIKTYKDKVKIQVGGGIRSLEAMHRVLQAGAARIVIGTKAVEMKGFIDAMLDEAGISSYGEDRVAVSLDCLNGYVTQRGWVEISHIKGVDFAKSLESMGIKTIIYTDISRDGTLQGPNLEAIAAMLDAVKINVIASGGVSSLTDVKKLTELKGKESDHKLWGAITGKAIYEGKLDFAEAVKLC